MLVQVNTDNHITGKASLQEWVRGEIEGAFERFSPQLTRVEVFLADLNSHKPAQNDQHDKQCKLEARWAGLDPIAVTKTADTVEVALGAAIDAMVMTLDSRVEKLRDSKRQNAANGEPGV
jgi:hypothetical protein